MHVFLQESEGGKQEVRVVNAWHQPKSTDTNLGTIASVFFFFFLNFFFFCTTTVTNRSALSVVRPDSDLGELYCRSVFVSVIPAAAGLAGARAACASQECCGFPKALSLFGSRWR